MFGTMGLIFFWGGRGIETKVGGSRHLPLQRLKDAWLGANDYPAQLIRKPGNW